MALFVSGFDFWAFALLFWASAVLSGADLYFGRLLEFRLEYMNLNVTGGSDLPPGFDFLG